jgi:hypothetical protein
MWMLLLSVQYSSQIGVSTMCFRIRQKLVGRHCWIKVMMLIIHLMVMVVVVVMMVMMMLLLVSTWTKTS